MSIKKDIIKMIDTNGMTVNLNRISHIYRQKVSRDEDILGREIDKITLVFKFVAGIKGGARYDIESRDYEGIIAEIQAYTIDYLMRCAEQANKNLENGYCC